MFDVEAVWVVLLHVPWYTSNAHHPMTEGADMREAMEPMFLAAGVDLVLNGHVHAYERTHPVKGDPIILFKGYGGAGRSLETHGTR